MLKEILEYLRQALVLTERTKKNRTEISALQKEFTDYAKAAEKQFASVKLELQHLNGRLDKLENNIQ